jgi:nucleotide-binding universal stress UspA family protein
MFKHILLPTDGSELSQRAVEQGIALAGTMGARVTGLYVAAPFHVLGYEPAQLQPSRDEYQRMSDERAASVLGAVSSAASAAGVPCDAVSAVGDDPYEEILRTAKANGCDLIVMASHGRRGVKALLLGSETQKVLTHGTVPVLVYR